MPRVKRISVEVEIEDDDGASTLHYASGEPRPGQTVATIEPHHRAQISRTRGPLFSELVDVRVHVEAVLTPMDGETLFRATGDRSERHSQNGPVVVIGESSTPALDA